MQIFTHSILKWYSLNKRFFPWRETKNPYYIWLSEIILQQTKTTQGLPYYTKFIDNYPTIEHLAKASEQDILKLWQGLGYYSRARNLHYTAKYIVDELNSKFPNTYKNLIQLKGIGDYTASAIASICFNEKEAVLDGNVFRILARYFGIYTDISSGNGKKEFKSIAIELLPNKNFGDYNQALMDFGATQCTPKNTNCHTCILNKTCFAFVNNEVTKLPVKKKKITVKKRFFNYLVLIDTHHKTILTIRSNKDIWQNLYEFPLQESNKNISKNNLLSEINSSDYKNIAIQEITKYNENPIIHKLSHQHIHTTFWILKTKNTLKNSKSFSEIKKLPVATLTHNFIESFTNS